MESKEYSFYEDYRDVVNLRSRDSVLVVGNAVFPGLTDFVGEVVTVKKNKELGEVLRANRVFDRIILTKSDFVSEQALARVISLNGGLVALYTALDDSHERFLDYLQRNHPFADVWKFSSNLGPVILTDAKGPVYGAE